ncbi:replication factor A protein 3 [Kockovaella imperatae]|uniref:Replication factor A protein 3 n=1 Tax=Kockovaella imperatae TaxID=4999 RepID=A0A1Y1UPB3_9TREE|nr:replication factor A protein 3 [Kockovaella imperatae]ORX39890.1 replication factor A protein 3 [Kockovaella imperatae]
MAPLAPEPRINASLLAKYRGQTVRLPAKVVKIVGSTATVEASDGGQIGVHLGRDMHIADTYVEIIGSVKDDLSLKALTSINLGDRLDMKAVQAVIEFSQSSKGEGILV